MSIKHIVKGMAFTVALLGFTSCNILSQTFGDGNGLLAETRIKKKDSEMRVRGGITDYAKEYLGTNYRSSGKSPSGFDCSGFVYYVMKEFNIQMAASSSSQESQGQKISKLEAQPGDLVFFRRSKKSRVFHVAMVLDNNNGDLTLIHSTTSRGVVIDRLKDSSYWKSKVMTFRNVVSDM